MNLPIDDEVSPQVGHHGGNCPVIIIEGEQVSREEIHQLISMSHSTINWGLLIYNLK